MNPHEVGDHRTSPESSLLLIDAVLETLSMLTVQVIACELCVDKSSAFPSREELLRLRESALRLAKCTEEISRKLAGNPPA
jgi:hypothetical protein